MERKLNLGCGKDFRQGYDNYAKDDVLLFEKWVSSEDMIKLINSFNKNLYSRDIFARLKI